MVGRSGPAVRSPESGEAYVETAPVEASGLTWTDAGMCALWDPASFTGIVDYDTWDAAFGEDEQIEAHICTGAFVPINIEADGAFQVLVRVGESATLIEREARYLVVTSKPYLFVSTGEARVCGIERVGHPVEHDGFALEVPAGRWAVTVHMIDWAKEPGSRDQDGRPTPDALPDFVVLLVPDSGGPYRTRVVTFDRESARTSTEPDPT